ncbi:MAG: hypothetical protein ACFFBH_15655 [Promethearchaeota archaeon]
MSIEDLDELIDQKLILIKHKYNFLKKFSFSLFILSGIINLLSTITAIIIYSNPIYPSCFYIAGFHCEPHYIANYPSTIFPLMIVLSFIFLFSGILLYKYTEKFL